VSTDIMAFRHHAGRLFGDRTPFGDWQHG
jgi:hypothetical protein